MADRSHKSDLRASWQPEQRHYLYSRKGRQQTYGVTFLLALSLRSFPHSHHPQAMAWQHELDPMQRYSGWGRLQFDS